MSSSPESLDVVCFEFSDLDSPSDTTVRPIADVILRRLFGQQLLSEQTLLRQRGDWERMLTLVQQQEQICRQGGNWVALSRCLGNEALLRKACGDLHRARELHHEQEQICRQLGDTHGVVFALSHQALLLAEHLGQPPSALPLAEEASQLAAQSGQTELIALAESTLEAIRRRLGKP